jgi:hypothetical protein
MAKPKYPVFGTVESKKSKSLQQKALEAPEYKKLKQARSPTAHQSEHRAAEKARRSRWSPEVQGSEMLPGWNPKDENFDSHDDLLNRTDNSHVDQQSHDDHFYDQMGEFYQKYYEPDPEAGFEENIWFERVGGDVRVRFGMPPRDNFYWNDNFERKQTATCLPEV